MVQQLPIRSRNRDLEWDCYSHTVVLAGSCVLPHHHHGRNHLRISPIPILMSVPNPSAPSAAWRTIVSE